MPRRDVLHDTFRPWPRPISDGHTPSRRPPVVGAAAKAPTRLTVRSVFSTYKAIANAKGVGSVEKRVRALPGSVCTFAAGATPIASSAREAHSQIYHGAARSLPRHRRPSTPTWLQVALIRGLLVAAQGNEALYIARAMMGKLRIGLLQSTVHVSLAHAFTYTEPYVARPSRK